MISMHHFRFHHAFLACDIEFYNLVKQTKCCLTFGTHLSHSISSSVLPSLSRAPVARFAICIRDGLVVGERTAFMPVFATTTARSEEGGDDDDSQGWPRPVAGGTRERRTGSLISNLLSPEPYAGTAIL